MKQLIDAVCVMLGNLMHGKPTSWAAAKEQAADMRKVSDAFKAVANLFDGDVVMKVEPPVSPLGYLWSGVVNVLAVIIAIYIGVMIGTGFFMILPWLALVAFAVVVYRMFSSDKPSSA